MSNGNRTLMLGNLPPVDQLTPIEAQVWALHKEGKSRAEIGEALSMKVNSVGRRLTTIKEKIAIQEAFANG